MIGSLDVRTVNILFLLKFGCVYLDLSTHALGQEGHHPPKSEGGCRVHMPFKVFQFRIFSGILGSINSFRQTPHHTFHFHLKDLFFNVTTTVSPSIRVLLPQPFSSNGKKVMHVMHLCSHISIHMYCLYQYLRNSLLLSQAWTS